MPSDEVHTPAPDFFELKPVLRPGQVADGESRSAAERSPGLPSTLWRKDVTAAGSDGASYYKNKQFHQGNHIQLCLTRRMNTTSPQLLSH